MYPAGIVEEAPIDEAKVQQGWKVRLVSLKVLAHVLMPSTWGVLHRRSSLHFFQEHTTKRSQKILPLHASRSRSSHFHSGLTRCLLATTVDKYLLFSSSTFLPDQATFPAQQDHRKSPNKLSDWPTNLTGHIPAPLFQKKKRAKRARGEKKPAESRRRAGLYREEEQSLESVSYRPSRDISISTRL